MAVDFSKLRQRMVDEQLIPRKISHPPTLKAMRTVPRERFVPDSLMPHAYEDGPLPIGEGQTISQPYMVALMAQAAELRPEATVLEIGTGSGYGAAVLSRLAREVYTIERISSLSEQAVLRFKSLGYSNVHAKVGDGSLGWPEKAPFDAIVVTAGAPVVPESLIGQLKEGGRLIIPVGDYSSQQLCRLRKEGEKYRQEILEYVRFVPLVGEAGWPD